MASIFTHSLSSFWICGRNLPARPVPVKSYEHPDDPKDPKIHHATQSLWAAYLVYATAIRFIKCSLMATELRTFHDKILLHRDHISYYSSDEFFKSTFFTGLILKQSESDSELIIALTQSEGVMV